MGQHFFLAVEFIDAHIYVCHNEKKEKRQNIGELCDFERISNIYHSIKNGVLNFNYAALDSKLNKKYMLFCIHNNL